MGPGMTVMCRYLAYIAQEHHIPHTSIDSLFDTTYLQQETGWDSCQARSPLL